MTPTNQTGRHVNGTLCATTDFQIEEEASKNRVPSIRNKRGCNVTSADAESEDGEPAVVVINKQLTRFSPNVLSYLCNAWLEKSRVEGGQNCRDTKFSSLGLPTFPFCCLLACLAMAVSTHVQCRPQLRHTPAPLSLMAKK